MLIPHVFISSFLPSGVIVYIVLSLPVPESRYTPYVFSSASNCSIRYLTLWEKPFFISSLVFSTENDLAPSRVFLKLIKPLVPVSNLKAGSLVEFYY